MNIQVFGAGRPAPQDARGWPNSCCKACSKNGNDLNLMSELEKNCCKQRGRFQGRDLIELQDSSLCANKIHRHSVMLYIAGRPTPSSGIPVQHAFDPAVKFTLSVLSMPLGEKLQAFDSCSVGTGICTHILRLVSTFVHRNASMVQAVEGGQAVVVDCQKVPPHCSLHSSQLLCQKSAKAQDLESAIT